MPSLTAVMPPDFPAGLLIGTPVLPLLSADTPLLHLSYTSPTPLIHLSYTFDTYMKAKKVPSGLFRMGLEDLVYGIPDRDTPDRLFHTPIPKSPIRIFPDVFKIWFTGF